MAEKQVSRPSASLLPMWIALVAVAAFLVGLFGLVLGPFYTLASGVVLLAAGLIMLARRIRSGWLLLVAGSGLIVGALLYIALGIFGPTEPASQLG